MSTRQPDKNPGTPRGSVAAALFARRFVRLREVIYPRSLGRPWTDVEIAEKTGLSKTYIGHLRTGKSVPGLDKATALARVFGVRVEYFTLPDDDPLVVQIESDLGMLQRERDGLPQQVDFRTAGSATDSRAAVEDDVRDIAEGARDLPPAMRQTVRSLVDQLRSALGSRKHGDGP